MRIVESKAHEVPYLGLIYAEPVQDYLAAGRPVITPSQERHQAYQMAWTLFAGRPASDYLNAYLITPELIQTGYDLILPYTVMQSVDSVVANIMQSDGAIQRA
jgi:hypothetical protein